MITRAQYMGWSSDGIKATHREYYGQFVTAGVRAMVAQRFTVEALVEAHAKDEHFNSIALQKWDSIAPYLPNSVCMHIQRVSVSIDGRVLGVSLSDRVCVLKEAALQIVESAKERA